MSLSAARWIIHWCHSAVLLGDGVTKDSDTARVSLGLSFRRGFRWQLIHDLHIFESSRNRANRGLDILEQLGEDEFAADVPRDLKSVTLIT